MKNKNFLLISVLIVLFAVLIRLHDYDKVPPQDEVFDEIHYAWGGTTWLKEGVPRSWSNFQSYKNMEYVKKYNINWRIVSPLIEKPPLYFLLSGLINNIIYKGDIFDTPHRVIRLLPLLLSIFTISLLIVFAKRLFDEKVAILAGLLYATTPTIVLANRLSVTENLLTPLFLLSAVLLIGKDTQKIRKSLLIGFVSALAFLTKQAGIAAAIIASLYFYHRRNFRPIFTIISITFIAVLVYLAFGAYYDWGLFVSLQNDVRVGHTLSGLPEMVTSIFRFPTIGPKNHPFMDGTILLGLLLLFTSPLYLKLKEKQSLLITFPLTYVLLLVVGQSGATPFSFFGWYLYPLFPFLIILTAKLLQDFWQKPHIYVSILLLLILGSSTIRFFFLNLPREYHYLWQYLFILVVLITFFAIVSKKKFAKMLLLILFTAYISTSTLTDFNLKQIYQNVAVNDVSLSGFNK